MCPLWPFHLILMYLLILGPLWFASYTAAVYAVKYIPIKFEPESLKLAMGETKEVYVYSEDPEVFKHKWKVTSDEEKKIVRFDSDAYLLSFNTYNNGTSVFNITGNFLGKTDVKLQSVEEKVSVIESEKAMSVIVIRGKQILDQAFTILVIVLVTILYAMYGCTMDATLVLETIKKPIAPVIGFFSQFLFMPLVSYALGRLLFPSQPVERLALFLTGLCPGGGQSNMWSIAVDANVNLSITMTTLSLIGAFGMFPLWLMTLGREIFEEAELTTPASRISSYLVSLIVPVAIGFAIQRFFPLFAKTVKKLLKPLSLILIVVIVLFACIAKWYLFAYFTWKVVLAGTALPWLGYLAGFLAAWFLKQPIENILAISIETGVQNTGIALFMIQVLLSQPEADIVTVIPIAVAWMSPIPPAVLTLFLKLRKWQNKKKKNRALPWIINNNERSGNLFNNETPSIISNNQIF